MATIPKAAIEVAYTVTGGPPITLSFPEAATQSFKRGEPVFLASGKVTICGADPAAILGVASHDASGVTDTPVKVWIASSSTIFVANLAVSQTTAVTQVGAPFGITIASAKTHVDTTKSTAQAANGTTSRVIVVGLDPRDAVGDINGRVHFVFMDKTGTTTVLYPLQIQV